jgi:hypothetical protein
MFGQSHLQSSLLRSGIATRHGKTIAGRRKRYIHSGAAKLRLGQNRKGTLGGWLFVPINLEEPDKKSSYFESQQLQH